MMRKKTNGGKHFTSKGWLLRFVLDLIADKNVIETSEPIEICVVLAHHSDRALAWKLPENGWITLHKVLNNVVLPLPEGAMMPVIEPSKLPDTGPSRGVS